MSPKKLNPEMLKLARDARGMTQKELSRVSGVSQAHISQIEVGVRESNDETADKLAKGLRFPVAFLYQGEHYVGFGLSMVYYRKKSTALVGHQKRLQAEVNIRRIHIKRLLDGVELETPRAFQFMDIEEYGSPEDIAIRLRASWMLPLGPIANLVTVIENAGGFVFKFPFGTSDIDAMSQWPDDSPPLFFLNAQAPADRIRFSLAHELGHVVMHEFATEDIEAEANRFAAEFLMPKAAISGHLLDLDLKRAASLKPYWRVSMAALVRRARDLKKISESRYRALYMQLGRLGYRSREPHQFPHEEPSLVPGLVDSYMTGGDLDTEGLSLALDSTVDDLRAMYFPAALRIAR